MKLLVRQWHRRQCLSPTPRWNDELGQCATCDFTEHATSAGPKHDSHPLFHFPFANVHTRSTGLSSPSPLRTSILNHFALQALTLPLIMVRGNDSTTKVHYKGQEDDFIVLVDSAKAVTDWKGDRTIPLAQVVSGWKVFVTHKHGTQGILDTASKGALESEFGTSKEEDVVQQILEKGSVQESENPGRGGSKNDSKGGVYGICVSSASTIRYEITKNDGKYDQPLAWNAPKGDLSRHLKSCARCSGFDSPHACTDVRKTVQIAVSFRAPVSGCNQVLMMLRTESFIMKVPNLCKRAFRNHFDAMFRCLTCRNVDRDNDSSFPTLDIRKLRESLGQHPRSAGKGMNADLGISQCCDEEADRSGISACKSRLLGPGTSKQWKKPFRHRPRLSQTRPTLILPRSVLPEELFRQPQSYPSTGHFLNHTSNSLRRFLPVPYCFNILMADRLDTMNPIMTSTPSIAHSTKSVVAPARAANNGNVIKRYVPPSQVWHPRPHTFQADPLTSSTFQPPIRAPDTHVLADPRSLRLSDLGYDEMERHHQRAQ
nr:sdo1-like protein c21c3.19 [Quercus suber]